jgi:hypothetical protein
MKNKMKNKRPKTKQKKCFSIHLLICATQHGDSS